jgi:hypothetical protein
MYIVTFTPWQQDRFAANAKRADSIETWFPILFTTHCHALLSPRPFLDPNSDSLSLAYNTHLTSDALRRSIAYIAVITFVMYVGSRQGDQIGRIIRLLGNSLLWASVLILQELPAFLGYFFQGKIYLLVVTETGWATILGDFFANESGHPGSR